MPVLGLEILNALGLARIVVEHHTVVLLDGVHPLLRSVSKLFLPEAFLELLQLLDLFVGFRLVLL